MKTLLLLICSLLSAPLVIAAEINPNISADDRAFFLQLKKAILNADREWVAANVCFPLKARIGTQTKVLSTKEEFLRSYTDIVTLDLVEVVRKQMTEVLIKSEKGIMIGDGEVWFSPLPADEVRADPKRTHCITSLGDSE